MAASPEVEKHTIVIVGGGGVGKTALTMTYLYNKFRSVYEPTIEEMYKKQVVVGKVPCMLTIIDTAGQEEYASLRDQYWSPGEGFIMVFSLADESSLREISKLADHVLKVKGEVDSFPMVLAGNKADLRSERKVTAEQAEALAEELGCKYIETSAKEGDNVALIFEQVVKQIWASKGDHSVSDDGGDGGCCTLL